jgi:hypothetical protein
LKGSVVKSFGGGMFIWPHGIDVDRDGNAWVTDTVSVKKTPPGKRGHQVVKFSPADKVRLTLGTPEVPGNGPDKLNASADVVVGTNGNIFVADGHALGRGNNRIRIFDEEGKFLAQ